MMTKDEKCRKYNARDVWTHLLVFHNSKLAVNNAECHRSLFEHHCTMTRVLSPWRMISIARPPPPLAEPNLLPTNLPFYGKLLDIISALPTHWSFLRAVCFQCHRTHTYHSGIQ